MVDEHFAFRLGKLCSVRSERHFDTLVIQLFGEFDLSCEEPFNEQLERALDGETSTLVLDLRGLTFIDSTGLRMLIVLDGHATEDGFNLVVLSGDGQVRRVLRESGLDGILPVVDAHAGAVPASDSPV